MGVSRREFAKLANVSEMAVRKAIKAGRIKLLRDNTIDAEKALVQWERSTDPARTKVRTKAKSSTKEAAAQLEPDEVGASDLLKRIAGTGSIDFGMARTADAILKARERELKMAERRKELVPLAKVREHVSKAFISFRQVVQRLPSRHVAAIAAELGCDAALLEAALSKAIAAELDGLSTPVVRA